MKLSKQKDTQQQTVSKKIIESFSSSSKIQAIKKPAESADCILKLSIDINLAISPYKLTIHDQV